MKSQLRILPLALLLGLISFTSIAQTLQASQNFDGGASSGIPYTGTATITSYTADQNSSPRPRNGLISNGYNSGTSAWNLINGGNGTANQSLTFQPINFQTGSSNNYIQFKLASLANVPNQGADLADNITVELSTDFGENFYKALTITGQNRRLNDPSSGAGETVWTYAANQTAVGAFNGSTPAATLNTTFTPANNGDLSPGGYSTVRINLTNTSRLVVRITLTNTDNNEIWAVDDFGVYSTLPVTLPVSLINFTASRHSQNVLVKWATASEVNNAYFEVQRSNDGKSFTSITKVTGNGTTALGSSYSFTDYISLTATSYYRLRQVDADGTASFSSVVAVSGSDKIEASFYPNPTNTQVTMPAISGLVKYRVYTATGQNVATGQAAGGSSVDIQHLPMGVYFLELISADKHNVQRFVKQ